MAGLGDTFGNRAMAQSIARMILVNEDWELGFRGGVPVFYATVTGRSIQDKQALQGALEEREINFGERLRQSNGSEVIEVYGDDFPKLSNILGEDRIKQLEIDLVSPVVNSVQWQEGMKSNGIPVIYADVTELDMKDQATIVSALSQLGIEDKAIRTNSSNREMLEVTGTGIPIMVDILERNGSSGNQPPPPQV